MRLSSVESPAARATGAIEQTVNTMTDIVTTSKAPRRVALLHRITALPDALQVLVDETLMVLMVIDPFLRRLERVRSQVDSEQAMTETTRLHLRRHRSHDVGDVDPESGQRTHVRCITEGKDPAI